LHLPHIIEMKKDWNNQDNDIELLDKYVELWTDEQK
jgi:hypothetical protein